VFLNSPVSSFISTISYNFPLFPTYLPFYDVITQCQRNFRKKNRQKIKILTFSLYKRIALRIFEDFYLRKEIRWFLGGALPARCCAGCEGAPVRCGAASGLGLPARRSYRTVFIYPRRASTSEAILLKSALLWGRIYTLIVRRAPATFSTVSGWNSVERWSKASK